MGQNEEAMNGKNRIMARSRMVPILSSSRRLRGKR
jgi:hypothetical protein